MSRLTIGAISKLTEIPTHTLRKWESRHGIGIPDRTETGRRSYSQEDVAYLRLVKRLADYGHSLRELAQLDLNGLTELAQMHVSQGQVDPEDRVTLVGPNLARLLLAHAAVAGRSELSFDEWWQQGAEVSTPCLVIELDTIRPLLSERLIKLRERVERLVVVYQFTSSSVLSHLSHHGVETVPAPVTDRELLLWLGPLPNMQPEVADPRFATKELARIAALQPGMPCECPKHIAKLLMDISSFEKYSSECSDENPNQQRLHQTLGSLAAQARVLMESALLMVAVEDGLEIKTQN